MSNASQGSIQLSTDENSSKVWLTVTFDNATMIINSAGPMMTMVAMGRGAESEVGSVVGPSTIGIYGYPSTFQATVWFSSTDDTITGTMTLQEAISADISMYVPPATIVLKAGETSQTFKIKFTPLG